MNGIDLDAVQARADIARAHLGDISRCEFLSITPGPSSHRGVAASQRDVPALIAAIRERDAAIARVRSVVDDWIDGRYGDDGYRVAPQPDDGHVLEHLRAAIDVEVGQ